MRSYTSAKRLASCHGSAARLPVVSPRGSVFGRSAITPLVSAPQKPRKVPAVSAMSVRLLDMGGDLDWDVRSVTRIDTAARGSRAVSARRTGEPGHLLAPAGCLGIVRSTLTR